MTRVLAMLTICAALSACAGERRDGDPVASRGLDSGITSSNGGGTTTLGNTPNISTGSGGAVRTRSNNGQGSSY